MKVSLILQATGYMTGMRQVQQETGRMLGAWERGSVSSAAPVSPPMQLSVPVTVNGTSGMNEAQLAAKLQRAVIEKVERLLK